MYVYLFVSFVCMIFSSWKQSCFIGLVPYLDILYFSFSLVYLHIVYGFIWHNFTTTLIISVCTVCWGLDSRFFASAILCLRMYLYDRIFCQTQRSQFCKNTNVKKNMFGSMYVVRMYDIEMNRICVRHYECVWNVCHAATDGVVYPYLRLLVWQIKHGVYAKDTCCVLELFWLFVKVGGVTKK